MKNKPVQQYQCRRPFFGRELNFLCRRKIVFVWKSFGLKRKDLKIILTST